uniref:Uncharacterized protein n=1 Tax=Arundo donax TaxID=35708 RepID=A0A0A9BKE2_ARUDO
MDSREEVGAGVAFAGVEHEDDAFDDVQLLSVASGGGYTDAGFPSKIS